MNATIQGLQTGVAGAVSSLTKEQSSRAQLRDSLRVQIATTIFNELETSQIEYVAISGYTPYPRAISTDLDMIFRKQDQQRLPAVMQRVATLCGARLASRLHYHYGKTYVFMLPRNGIVAELWCDTATEFRQAGRLWLRAEDLLRDRQMDSRGFYVAAPSVRFLYHSIKKLNKLDLGLISDMPADQLTSRYCECSTAADAQLTRIFTGATAKILKDAFVSGKWNIVQKKIKSIGREMRKHGSLDSFASRTNYLMGEAVRKLQRFLTPTGICVVIAGDRQRKIERNQSI